MDTEGAVEEFYVQRWGKPIRCIKVTRPGGVVELFHVNRLRTELKRGMPVFPWKTAEDVTRPYNLWTLANAEYKTGINVHELREALRDGKLPGIYKKWRYGRWHREAWFVTEEAVKEYMRKRIIEKFEGRLNWDVSSETVMENSKAKP